MRTQAEYLEDPDLRDFISLETGLECDPAEDVARQEYKADTDVNRVLAGFGVGFKDRPLTYADVDGNLDLQQALEARDAATRALRTLPQPVKDQFPTWEALIAATANGDLKRALQAHEEATRTPPPTPPT